MNGLKLIRHFLLPIIGVLCFCGCTSSGNYFSQSYELKSVSDYLGSVIVVDSIKGTDFMLLLSKNNHMFYIPTSKIEMVTDDMNEQTIFQIPEVGLFSWEFGLDTYVDKRTIKEYVCSDYGDYYTMFSEIEKYRNQNIRAIPLTKEFSIVPVEITPDIIYRFLDRGDTFQFSLNEDDWFDYRVCRESKCERFIDNPKFHNLPFLDPYAYYPFYSPMFKVSQERSIIFKARIEYWKRENNSTE